MEAVMVRPDSGVTSRDVLAGPAGPDFSTYYAKELSSLVWFAMSLGADAHKAADIAFMIAAQRREDLMRDASRSALARTVSRRPSRVGRRVWPRLLSPATALLVGRHASQAA